MVIVPAIGRILRFAPAGGPNLLWENSDLWGQHAPPAAERRDWANFGGDKIWPAPQERWSWPPDPWLDGSPYACTIRQDNSVRMASPVSPRTQLRIVRTVRLDPRRLMLTLENRLENHGPTPVEWAVWEVAQLEDPEWVEMPRSVKRFAPGFRLFPDTPDPGKSVSTSSDAVKARRNTTHAYKIGSDAAITRVHACKGTWVFTIEGPGRREAPYPDAGCNVEIYSNPDPLTYMEAEVLGPLETIPPGGAAAMKTVWFLSRNRATRRNDP